MQERGGSDGGMMMIWGEPECVAGRCARGPGLGLVGRGEIFIRADSHGRVLVVLLYTDGWTGRPIAIRERGRIVKKVRRLPRLASRKIGWGVLDR